MDQNRARELASLYRNELNDSVVPFWLPRAVDEQQGGFFTCFDHDGTLYDRTKYVWLQGRFVWTLGRLYNTVEKRAEWLQWAAQGLDFIRNRCFDESGRMYFAVTETGERLTRPWGIFSECFTVCGLCQYALVTGDEAVAQEARDLFWRTVEMTRVADLDSLSYPEIPRLMTHAVPMILVNVIQELRALGDDPHYTELGDVMLDRVLNLHSHPEERVLLENVWPDGRIDDSPDGRTINPGHALESAWFLLREAEYRNDTAIRDRAIEIIEWSFERGWDEKYGGLFYFTDLKGMPSPYLEWDMKLWWVQVEALYATLLVHQMTGRQDMLDWFECLHEWSWERFRDSENGEWFGYLNCNGERSLSLKGSMWKGFYHLPRGLMLITEALEKIASE